jgi:hypothetical protein
MVKDIQTYTSKYGCWVVNQTPYSSKINALQMSKTDSDIRFYYHDYIWSKFDKSQLGKVSLTSLYKERAQQLRDKYEHLVLHYSGGSDSHNILYTFLSNNIKLDEISVRWAKPLIDGKFYTPNFQDRSAKNAASEWNYTIEPTLRYIKEKHPDIKITIVDFTEKLNLLPNTVGSIEESIQKIRLNRGAFASFVQRFDSGTETKSSIFLKKEKIGHIFGVEKPMLSLINNKIYMRFTDSAIETALLPNAIENKSVELFYWSHEFPLLTYEQAYQTALFFKENKSIRDLLWGPNVKNLEEANNMIDLQSEYVKKILYSHSWDFSKFQVGKPNLARSDWWHWLHSNPELRLLKRNYETAMNNITSTLNQKFVMSSENISFFKPLATTFFHVLDLE